MTDVGALPEARDAEQQPAPRTKRIVVAMPAYRAARTLEKTVNALPADAADALLLVDDASPDDTVAVANRLGLQVRVHPKNLGYGGNQKTCYDEALRLGADVVVLLHPDFQYDPRAVPALVAPILAGRADFTFGSRFAGGSDPRLGGMPLYRYVGNKLTTMLMNLLLGTQFTETHSGFKAYSRRFLEAAPYRGYSDDFVFDTQILLAAVAGGFVIEEVPIPTRYTEESSSIGIQRSLRYIQQSLLLAWHTRRQRPHPLPLSSMERGDDGERTPRTPLSAQERGGG